MTDYSRSLMGYALPIHQRDHFRCCYCGLDGTKCLANWLSLSADHLLPQGHPNRDCPEYIVTACMFCNTAANRLFEQAEARGLRFENMTPDNLVKQRRPYIEKTRSIYKQFWEEKVRAPEAKD